MSVNPTSVAIRSASHRVLYSSCPSSAVLSHTTCLLPFFALFVYRFDISGPPFLISRFTPTRLLFSRLCSNLLRKTLFLSRLSVCFSSFFVCICISALSDPWCFYPNGFDSTGSLDQQCAMQNHEKVDCGYAGIGQALCEARNCCWSLAPSGMHFFPLCCAFLRV